MLEVNTYHSVGRELGMKNWLENLNLALSQTEHLIINNFVVVVSFYGVLLVFLSPSQCGEGVNPLNRRVKVAKMAKVCDFLCS